MLLGSERKLPPLPPDSLVLRTLVLRMSDCPSPTLTAQPESGQLMRSTY
uniref:Orf56 n=1 Tax=Ipomoea batatas TaxID=4120 RepID=A0A0C5GDK1_IPOBA|nr:orf56 [Ipomoea batatas]YP_009128456.1 orf56 [Ipomoea batatas]AJP09613.1 orf56 [Ipomoea batatas]AJP09628.1 orf56 [Ipomoea batatas]